MKLTSNADVNDLENAYLTSAALNTAIELGLFWNLAQQPQTASQISLTMQIPAQRCRAWLELLVDLGLLEKEKQVYTVSPLCHTAILDGYSQATEMFLAEHRRGLYGAGMDLALYMRYPGSVWEAQGRTTPSDYQIIKENPVWAERFTQMLYEIHEPFAVEVAEIVDMTGVQQMMDLGGGSGVMSFALVRRHPHLTSVVVDLANVCIVGREIAAANSLAERVTYFPADLVWDELPTGFDLVLQCGLGIYSVEHLSKIRNILNQKGRLLIIQRFAQSDASTTLSSIEAFRRTLDNPDYSLWTLVEMQQMLREAGFEYTSERTLSTGELLVEALRS
jgi:hypothetical protein